MNRTNIEWVVNPDGSRPGWSWNPLTGCLNNCSYCFARKLANGRLKPRYLANKNWDTRTPQGYEGYPNLDPFYPRFWDSRLEELRQRNINLIEKGLDKPRGVFVCDMGELFGDWLPLEWQETIMEEIDNKHDRFYLLTKQPQNLIKWSPYPPNVYLGVTVTNQKMFDKAVYYLKMVDAKVKFLSIEPLLGRINLDL